MENKQQLLERFKNVEKGNAIFVDENEFQLCQELKNEGKINFIYNETMDQQEVFELAEPKYLL